MSVKADAGQAAREVGRSDALHHAVRFGLVCYALVHLVLAWLGLQLALGDREDKVDEHGALHELSQQPYGEVVLLLVVLGMALLVLWRLVELLVEHHDEDTWDRWRHRAIAVGTGVMYLLIGVTALMTVLGDGSGAQHRERAWTATLLAWPAGPWLVGLVGASFVGYMLAMGWRGLTGRHAKHLDAEGRRGESGRLYLLLGTLGYLAKGFAVGIVGSLVIAAAVTHDAQRSGGLDTALSRLLHQPSGPWLLGAISVGLGCYGAFELTRAAYLSRRAGK